MLRSPFHTKARHIALFWHFNADRQTETWKTSTRSWKASFAFKWDKCFVKLWYIKGHVKGPRMVSLYGEMPFKAAQTNSGLGWEQCHWASAVLHLPYTHINPCTLACAKNYVSLILKPDLGILLGSKWHFSVTVLNTAEGLKRPCRCTRHPVLKNIYWNFALKIFKYLKSCD